MPQDPYASIAQAPADPYAAIASAGMTPLDLKNPSTIPNARVRNMTVDPTKDVHSTGQAFYEGAKTGLDLGMIPSAPSAIAAPVSTALGLGGATVGSMAGKGIAKSAGAGDFGQEVGGDLGALLGGALTAGVANVASSKARSFYDTLPADLQKKLAGVAPTKLKNAIDFWEAYKDFKAGKSAPTPELDATGENVPYAGEKPPKPAPWNAHDATGENKAFAGGMDEWSPKPSRSIVVDPKTGRPEFSDVHAISGAPSPEQLQAAQPKPKVKLTNDPLLNKLRLIAAKIEMDEKGTPSAVNGGEEDDLTPLLLESLHQVKANRAP